MDNIVQIPVHPTLSTLWEQVLEKHLRPEDDYEVAALLESFGWTDGRASAEFGVANVFELAKEMRQYSHHQVGITVNQYKEKEPVWPIIRQYCIEFFRGMIFALPMLLSIVAMLILRFSLWSYFYLPTRIATSIAVGTLLSFVSVGGFMQAMARQGYFYKFQGRYRMMRRMTVRLITLGVLASLIVSVIGIVLDVIFPELPYDMLAVALLYYLVLNAIWLAVAVLYILRKELWFTLLLASGIGLVYVGFRLLHMNILIAQLIAMSVIAIASLILLRYFFFLEEKEHEDGINPAMPRFSVTAYNIAPYFTYGGLYFALLFIDRIMAWSTYSSYVPVIIWFRGNYELGLDFALTVLIIPMGLSEVIVSRMMTQIWSSQKDYLAVRYTEMNAHFTQLYRKSIFLMAVVCVLNAILVYIAVYWLIMQPSAVLKGRVVVDSVTIQVFIISLISYTILAVGLLHSVVIFSLSRPELVVRPILLSLALNFVVGFLLTRWISYPMAVWGLLAGCVCFLVLTSRNVNRCLRMLDYHMYFLS